jgi:hypothetical protein
MLWNEGIATHCKTTEGYDPTAVKLSKVSFLSRVDIASLEKEINFGTVLLNSLLST